MFRRPYAFANVRSDLRMRVDLRAEFAPAWEYLPIHRSKGDCGSLMKIEIESEYFAKLVRLPFVDRQKIRFAVRLFGGEGFVSRR